MSELVAYYDENPVEVKGRVEISQLPAAAAIGAHSVEGAIRASLVYVRSPRDEGVLVPFGDYDEWSLRDRFNEAIRIMNTLGASSITCETFGEVSARRLFHIRVGGRGAELKQQRIKLGAFDFRHDGAGSAPRDPRPLRWPDEPGFAAACSSVLDNGSAEVEINIRSKRTHAIDGSLGVQLKKLGFDLGGSIEQSGATSFHIRANFPQSRKGWK